MADKEPILKLGVEGGGATVYRTPLGSGGWQFHVKRSSMYLDENDDEGWRSWRSEPVLSVEEALRSIAEDGSWSSFPRSWSTPSTGPPCGSWPRPQPPSSRTDARRRGSAGAGTGSGGVNRSR